MSKENQIETHVPNVYELQERVNTKFVYVPPDEADAERMRVLSRRDNNPFKSLPCDSPVPLDLASNRLTEPEPMPTTNDEPFMWDVVINEVLRDMRSRDEFGAKKYNTRLQPNTNRDALKDAYQEALDLVVYLRTAIYERDGK